MGWEDYDKMIADEQAQCVHEWEQRPALRACTKCFLQDRNHPCSHSFEQVSREELGWDGGGHHDGRGEKATRVVRRCTVCGWDEPPTEYSHT